MTFFLKSYTPCFLYLFCALLLLPMYQYFLNWDGIGYISAAEKYAAGDWLAAVNGCWSPLISWLGAISLKTTGLSASLAFKGIIIAAGFGVMTQLAWYGKQLLPTAEKWQYFLQFAIIPMLLHYTYTGVSPDLLAVFLLLYLVRCTYIAWQTPDFRNWLPVGALAAAAYFAKSYNFLFILTGILFLFIILSSKTLKTSENEDFQAKKSKLWLGYITSTLVFMFFTSFWVIALHTKYQKWTISTAGAYNHSLSGPYGPIYDENFENQLHSLPQKADYSYWDDPSFISFTPYHPFTNLSDAAHQAKVVYHLLVQYVATGILFYALPFAILLVFGLFHTKIQGRRWGFTETLLLIAVTYPLAYFPLHLEERYVFFPFLLLYILSVKACAKFAVLAELSMRRKQTIAVLVAATMSLPAIFNLAILCNLGYDDVRFNEQLTQKNIVLRGSYLAADDFSSNLAMQLAFKNKAHFLGFTTWQDSAKIARTIDSFKLDYVFLEYPSSTSRLKNTLHVLDTIDYRNSSVLVCKAR